MMKTQWVKRDADGSDLIDTGTGCRVGKVFRGASGRWWAVFCDKGLRDADDEPEARAVVEDRLRGLYA
jgi:hypothetical protein